MKSSSAFEQFKKDLKKTNPNKISQDINIAHSSLYAFKGDPRYYTRGYPMPNVDDKHCINLTHIKLDIKGLLKF